MCRMKGRAPLPFPTENAVSAHAARTEHAAAEHAPRVDPPYGPFSSSLQLAGELADGGAVVSSHVREQA